MFAAKRTTIHKLNLSSNPLPRSLLRNQFCAAYTELLCSKNFGVVTHHLFLQILFSNIVDHTLKLRCGAINLNGFVYNIYTEVYKTMIVVGIMRYSILPLYLNWVQKNLPFSQSHALVKEYMIAIVSCSMIDKRKPSMASGSG